MGSESKKKRQTKREVKQSTLPPGEAKRILDTIAILETVIPPGEVRQVLQDTGCLDTRRCPLTREVIFWTVLAIGLFPELCIRQVFKHARRLNSDEWDPTRSTLCKARQRLGIAPLRPLFARVVHLLATADTPADKPASAAPAGDAKPIFSSGVVHNDPVAIKADLKGVKELYLVVTDAGDGFNADWADWLEPGGA